mmetsp:Transcript_98372/g.264418  ORF Transcript_98372/g.264418 Transcript_98372/m.264418 type:complete len:298 (+) Transcript_98372:511-1404(+)
MSLFDSLVTLKLQSCPTEVAYAARKLSCAKMFVTSDAHSAPTLPRGGSQSEAAAAKLVAAQDAQPSIDSMSTAHARGFGQSSVARAMVVPICIKRALAMMTSKTHTPIDQPVSILISLLVGAAELLASVMALLRSPCFPNFSRRPSPDSRMAVRFCRADSRARSDAPTAPQELPTSVAAAAMPVTSAIIPMMSAAHTAFWSSTWGQSETLALIAYATQERQLMALVTSTAQPWAEESGHLECGLADAWYSESMAYPRQDTMYKTSITHVACNNFDSFSGDAYVLSVILLLSFSAMSS